MYTCYNKQVQYTENCNNKLPVNCLMAHLISWKDILTPNTNRLDDDVTSYNARKEFWFVKNDGKYLKKFRAIFTKTKIYCVHRCL